MKKAAIFLVYVLVLISLVSCTDTNYDAKLEEAKITYDKGDPFLAIRMLDQAIDMNSLDYHAYAMRGYFYWQVRKYDRAAADYRKAIERGAKSCNYDMGKLLVDIGRPLDAIGYLYDYIEYDDKNPEVYLLLSNIYEHAGDGKSAEDVRKKGYKATGDKRLAKPV